jgi:hypothetical protein
MNDEAVEWNLGDFALTLSHSIQSLRIIIIL